MCRGQWTEKGTYMLLYEPRNDKLWNKINGPTCRISSYTYSLAISAKVMEVVQTPSINKEALLQRPREGCFGGE